MQVYTKDKNKKYLFFILIFWYTGLEVFSLHAKVQAEINEMSTTANKVTKMFELVFNFEEELDKRQKAADNMIVLT